MRARRLVLVLLALAVAGVAAPGTAQAFPNPECAPPTISGTAHLGNTLTASQSACTGFPSPTISFSWARCNSASGSGCVGAGTGSTHPLTADDVGKYMRLRRTATNGFAPNDVDDVFSAKVEGPPSAGFAFSPGSPLTGDVVTFTSTSTDPDGDALSYAWDLDGDGAFDDASGAVAHASYTNPGSYIVSLQVTADGETSTVFRTVDVDPRAGSAPPSGGGKKRLRLLRPFPKVAIGGYITAGGVRLTLLGVKAPRGSKVMIKCRGRGCPRRTTRKRVGRKKTVTFRSFRRRFRAGTVIVVYVWKKDRIGKYTRFRIRRNSRPARRDRCLHPTKLKPTRCP